MSTPTIRLPNPDSPLIVSLGGGVNSTAMLILLHESGIRPQAILFADAGGERPETYTYVNEHLAGYLRSINFPPITTVTGFDGPSTTLEDACLRRAYLPSLAYGFRSCSDKWKRRPQRRWVKAWPVARAAWKDRHPVTWAIGYDAGEQHRRHVDPTRWHIVVYPLQDAGWNRAACADAINRVGLYVPPRSSCFFCPGMRKAEILALNHCHPNLIERACRLEAVAFAAGNARYPRGLGRHWTWRDLISAPPDKYNNFEDYTTMPCACWDGEPTSDPTP